MADNTFTRTTLSNLFDIILDPRSVVDRLSHSSSWLYPLIIIGVGTFFLGLASLPLLARVIENSLPPGIQEEQARQTLESFLLYQKIGLYLSPVWVALKCLTLTALLLLSCLMLDMKTNFKKLFALVSQCGLITFLQQFTILLIIKIRGESVQTASDLNPRLGLDLFFQNLGKPLMLVLNYFSLFNICYIAVLTIALSSLCNCSKFKAFVATIPTWLLPLGFSLGMLYFGGGL